MKMYNPSGREVLVDKGQIDALKIAGWTKEAPELTETKESTEAEVEAKVEEIEVPVKEKETKSPVRKKRVIKKA